MAVGARQNRLMHGRHGGVPGGADLVEPAEKVQRVEARVQLTEAPAAMLESVAAIRPWIWNSGMMFMHTSSGVRCSICPMLRADAATLRCHSGTILGRAVVPEVCSTSTTSSASANPGADGAWLTPSAASLRSVNAPAGPSLSGTRLTIGMWRAAATSRDGLSIPSRITSARALRSDR